MPTDLNVSKGISPAEQRWLWWPLLPLRLFDCNWFEGLVLELSPDFCSIG